MTHAAAPPRPESLSLDDECRRLQQALAEQSRRRELLAYEIHDGLSQYLSGAILHLEACGQDALPPAAATNLAEARRLILKADAEARAFMQGLLAEERRPPALDHLGLGQALVTLVAEARRHIPDSRLLVSVEDAAVSDHLASAIYRIVHEAVANACRHAAARSLDVALDRCPSGLRIHVRDDGRGFDPALVPAGHLGLEGIRTRARLLGGTARIDSGPGRGTTVEVELPA